MIPETLTIAVFFGTGTTRQDVQKIIETVPSLQPIEQALDPQEFIRNTTVEPDLVLIEVDGESQFPEWLENMSRRLPQSAIMACSHSWKPDFLIRATQSGVREFLTLPISKIDIEAAIERLPLIKKAIKPAAYRQGHVIVVAGYKGGVGTTTIAVNLAAALGELANDKVALVDLGRPFGDISKILAEEATYSLSDLIHSEVNLDWNLVQKIMQPYSPKLDILHGSSNFEDHNKNIIELLEQTINMLRQKYKYIVVDLSHWLDELFFKLISEADTVLLLSGITIVDLYNLKKLWPLFTKWDQGRGKIKIIINRLNKGNSVQLNHLEQIIQAQPFETLPSDFFHLLDALNQGAPLGKVAPRSKLWQKIKNLAERIQQRVAIISGEAEAKVNEAPSKTRLWGF